MEPTFRFGTGKAMKELAEELNLRIEDWMQDWPYEVANPSEIEKYIAHYNILKDEDKKFVLMEAIIQATEDQLTNELFFEYSNRIKPIIEKDFIVHEYTIHYWSCFDNENIEDCWRITAFMRQLWTDNHKLRIQ